MPPFLGGGEMILNVTKEGFTTTEIPWKFEAGTPMVAEAVGLGAAIDYLDNLGMDNVRAHEIELTDYALRTLNERYGDKIVIHGPRSPASAAACCRSSTANPTCGSIPTTSPRSSISGRLVRAGHHCAKPLLQTMNVPATSRASVTSTTTNPTSMPSPRPSRPAATSSLSRLTALFQDER